MTTMYLIRHAEAEGNLYRRSQGQYNSNLTALGMRQLTALAERFRDIPLDALWSSDLNRTQSTASAILKYHPALSLHLTERLREIDVGVWEDKPWGNLAEAWPEQMEYFTYDPERWSVPGGEPWGDVRARVRGVVLELAARYDGKTIACVTHGLAVRALLSELLDVPSSEIWRLPYGDNTSVSLLTVEDGVIRPVWYNDASHLETAGLSTFARQGWRKLGEKPKTPPVYATLHPLDPAKEGALYARCYERTWLASHGNLAGFTPVVYLQSAARHAARDERCVMRLDWGGRLAGVVELDPDRGAEDGAGWISLVWIEPEMRSRRLGVQLLGHAVSFFRRQGRTAIRLHVAESNETAIGFYEHVGFRKAGTARGVGGPLFLMEWDIRQRVVAPEEIL